jgi:hypothetical protein
MRDEVPGVCRQLLELLKARFEVIQNDLNDIRDYKTEVDTAIASKADKNATDDLQRKVDEQYAIVDNYKNLVDSLNKEMESMKMSKACNDYVLSDPPTLEELTEINKMNLGSFYTINGGNVMLVFRKPYALPLVKSSPAVF